MAVYEDNDFKWYLRADREHFHTLVNDLHPTYTQKTTTR